MSAAATARPTDATLSVTKAARLLGVHPNTVRAWSDAGRLRYYRINPRGDRRYRMGDLQRFLTAAENLPTDLHGIAGHGGRRTIDPSAIGLIGSAARGLGHGRTGTASDPLSAERHRRDLTLLDTIARLTLDP